MDAKEARGYLNVILQQFKIGGETNLEKYVEALQVAMDGITPPSDGWNYRWVYLPEADLMPYTHLEKIRTLSDTLEKNVTVMEQSRTYSPGHPIARLPIMFDYDEANLIHLALLIYRNVLMSVHSKRIQDGLSSSVERLSTIGDTESE